MRLSSWIACLMIFSLSCLTSCTSKPAELAVSPSPLAIEKQTPSLHPTIKEIIPDPSELVVLPSLPSTEASPSPNTGAREQVVEIVDAKIIYNPDITFDELKKSVKLGEHINETIKILGNDYDEYPSYYENDTTIRYYYANVEDHSYQFTHIHDNIVNDSDNEGLLNENIKYQLSVLIHSDIVTTYILSYKHSDGKIHAYYEWADGYSKEDIYE